MPGVKQKGMSAMKRKVFLGCLLAACMLLLCSCGEKPVSYNQAPFRRAGSIVTFGSYEQDNNTENGKEGIEWFVLEYSDGICTLISRHGLDARGFHTENTNVAWPDCELRSWLNNEFLNSAFAESEKKAIITTTLDNGMDQNGGYTSNNVYGVDADYTLDKVFLLSKAEFDRYLKGDDKKECKPTEYAVAKGAPQKNGAWWLRSVVSSFGENKAYSYDMEFGKTLYGDFSGKIKIISSSTNFDYYLVRPVVCLDLTAECFK